jgi:hypothetical protein
VAQTIDLRSIASALFRAEHAFDRFEIAAAKAARAVALDGDAASWPVFRKRKFGLNFSQLFVADDPTLELVESRFVVTARIGSSA